MAGHSIGDHARGDKNKPARGAGLGVGFQSIFISNLFVSYGKRIDICAKTRTDGMRVDICAAST